MNIKPPICLVALWSQIQAVVRKLEMAAEPRGPRYHGVDRRRNPRWCPLCGGPMKHDTRPPRDARGPDGKIKRMPEETLEWFRCERCKRGQIGVPYPKLQNGWRPAAW